MLLNMLRRQKQLLVGHNLFRVLRGLRRLRQLRNSLVLRLVLYQQTLSSIYQHLDILRLFRSHRDILFIDVCGGQQRLFPIYLFSLFLNYDLRILIPLCSIDHHMDMILCSLQIQSRMDGRILYSSHLLIRHKILLEGLFLKRLQPGEIRLVLGEHAGHQLDVGTILVSQVSVPGLSEVSAAPGPLLLSGRDMMVRHMKQAGLFLIVISAHEIIVGMLRHIGGGNRDILIAGNIYSLTVIMFIIYALGNGKTGHVTLAMVHNRVHIRRENGLSIIIDSHCRIRPPEESLGHGSPVVKLAADLYVSLSRVKGKRCDTLRSVHLIHIVHQQGFASVFIFLKLIIHRHIGGRSVVLGPVEFDSSRNPGPRQSYQRRLNHMIVVYKIIVIGLIIGSLNPSPQLRQNHRFDILIFQEYRLILLICLHSADFLSSWIRIDLSAAPLINSFFQEHGIFVRFSHLVGRNHNPLFPDFYFTHFHVSFLSKIYLFCFIISMRIPVFISFFC